MKRIPNKEADYYVTERVPFIGHNLYALQLGSFYVVYSYGPYWPIWVWDGKRWYGNIFNYSPITARHKHLTRPRGIKPDEIIWMSLKEITRLVEDHKRVKLRCL